MKAKELANLLEHPDDTRLFLLGRKVNFALPFATLRPRSADMKKAAKQLGITQAEAWRAWNQFTWERM